MKKGEEKLNRTFNSMYDGLSTQYEFCKTYPFKLKDREMTDAIINRMIAFIGYHDNIKKLFEKKQRQAASDFFVESTLFFAKVYLESHFKGVKVKSEIAIGAGSDGKAVRPDITIWKNDKLLGVIEMKVQLGRIRNSWREHLLEREGIVKEIDKQALFFVLCYSERNWKPGFDRKSKNFNTKYFSLIDMHDSRTKCKLETILIALKAKIDGK